MDNVKNLYGHPWNEREYVIALHYYFIHRNSPLHEDSAFVQEVAKILETLPAEMQAAFAQSALASSLQELAEK